MKYFILLLLIFSIPAKAEYNLGLEYFDITYGKYKDMRDPYVPYYDGLFTYQIATNFRVHLGHMLYWDNNVRTDAVKSRVATVAWHYVVGLRVHKNIDIFWDHESRHVFDREPLLGGPDKNVFPVYDRYGIRLKIIDDAEQRNPIIGE